MAVAIAGLLFAFARPALGEVRVERGDGAGACPDGAAFTARVGGDDEGRPPIDFE